MADKTEIEKRVTIYYAKDQKEADAVLLFLEANGIQGKKQSLGKDAYRDIYGGNGVYGQEISVPESDEERSAAVVKAYLSQKEKPAEKKGTAGKVLVLGAAILVLLFMISNYL